MTPIVGRKYWVAVDGFGYEMTCKASGEYKSVFGPSERIVQNDDVISESEQDTRGALDILRDMLHGKGGWL